MEAIKTVLYIIAQSTWGILQSFSGLILFLANLKHKHYIFHGAIVTEWSYHGSVSLGMFIFLTDKSPVDRRKNPISRKEMHKRLLVHEYGHTIQSLIFGPVYLIAIGLPSILWASLPFYRRKRRNGISYFDFFTEKQANYLGERITHEPSPENAVI